MEIVLSIGCSPVKCTRPSKGKSLLAMEPNYTVIDIETTGLDPQYDEIIELAALRVREGQITDRYESLVHPHEPVDSFITELTGITNEMLETAPDLAEVLPQYLNFIGSDLIVGHNVNFDINFIYDKSERVMQQPVKNDFVDTMRLSRRALPDLPHHKLSTLVEYFKISQDKAHRALADCEATQEIYTHLCDYIREHNIDLSAKRKHGLKAADIHGNSELADPDSPLYGKVCVFTGSLEKMVRREAMQIVTDIGGICADSVTAKTNFLILGNNDYCSSIKDGKSTKQKKAEGLILKGKDLTIISENVFYDMISASCKTDNDE